jgi:hypothetical protein
MIDTSPETWRRLNADQCLDPTCPGTIERTSDVHPDRETGGGMGVVGCTTCGKRWAVSLSAERHGVKALPP